MTLTSFVEDEATGLLLPTLARRQVIPYDDLQALGTPMDLPQISHDLLSTLAILVGQGPTKPVMVRADAIGRLQTSGIPASISKLTAPAVGGTTTIVVQDSSDFFPGQGVSLVSATGAVGACTGMQISSIPDPHTILVSASCVGHDFSVGDFLVGGGDTRVTSILIAPHIGGPITMLPPGSSNPGDIEVGMVGTVHSHKRLMVDAERSYDWQVFGAQTSNAQLTITSPTFGAGTRVVVGCIIASAFQSAVVGFDHLQLWLDSLAGTQLMDEILAPPAANTSDRFVATGLRVKANDNLPAILTMTIAAVNFFHSCFMAGWIEG